MALTTEQVQREFEASRRVAMDAAARDIGRLLGIMSQAERAGILGVVSQRFGVTSGDVTGLSRSWVELAEARLGGE